MKESQFSPSSVPNVCDGTGNRRRGPAFPSSFSILEASWVSSFLLILVSNVPIPCGNRATYLGKVGCTSGRRETLGSVVCLQVRLSPDHT